MTRSLILAWRSREWMTRWVRSQFIARIAIQILISFFSRLSSAAYDDSLWRSISRNWIIMLESHRQMIPLYNFGTHFLDAFRDRGRLRELLLFNPPRRIGFLISQICDNEIPIVQSILEIARVFFFFFSSKLNRRFDGVNGKIIHYCDLSHKLSFAVLIFKYLEQFSLIKSVLNCVTKLKLRGLCFSYFRSEIQLRISLTRKYICSLVKCDWHLKMNFWFVRVYSSH